MHEKTHERTHGHPGGCTASSHRIRRRTGDGARRVAAFVGSAWLAVAGVASSGAGASFLYAADGALSSAGNLYTVDVSTGLTTSVGRLVDASGARYAINGMAWSDANGWLWGTTSGSSPTLANGLVRIDPLTARVTPIGLLGFSPANFGADLDLRNGTLYGWAENSLSALVAIDTLTGAGTLVGPNGRNLNTTGGGLASNAAGTMFSTPDFATGNLWQVNVATGQLFGATPLSGGTPFARIGALEFLGSTLYGVELVGDAASGITSNRLIAIDPLTGAITSIGQFRDAMSLQFRPHVDAIAVPAPAVPCLLGIVGLVGGLRGPAGRGRYRRSFA